MLPESSIVYFCPTPTPVYIYYTQSWVKGNVTECINITSKNILKRKHDLRTMCVFRYDTHRWKCVLMKLSVLHWCMHLRKQKWQGEQVFLPEASFSLICKKVNLPLPLILAMPLPSWLDHLVWEESPNSSM